MAAGHRAEFERERERADRLMAMHVTAEIAAGREAAASLKVKWRLCGPAAEPVARSTARDNLCADWGNWLRLWWKQTARLLEASNASSLIPGAWRGMVRQKWPASLIFAK